MDKVAIIHLDMKIGGIERQLLNWINYVNCTDRLYLILCKKEGELLSELRPEVKTIEIGSYPVCRIDVLWMLKVYKIVRNMKVRTIFSLHGRFHWMAILFKLLPPGFNVILSQPGYAAKGRLFSIHKCLYKFADFVIPVSEKVGEILVKEWGLKNVFVINNSTDAKIITATREYNKDHRFRIISVSRIDRNKNIRDVILAIDILYRLGYIIDYTIVGDGPELAACKQLSNELELKNLVKFVGFSLRPQDYIQDCDLLVLNSRNEGGAPTVILEAWASRTLVLTSNYFGRDDSFIKDGENGFVCFDNSPQGLVEKIKTIIDLDDSFRVKIASTAMQLLLQKYSQRQYVEKYEQLFCDSNEKLELASNKGL